jgi:hypothetical protein
MSSFEELLYWKECIEKLNQEKEEIDKQIYTLLNQKREIDIWISNIREYNKSLISEILITKK